MSLSCGTVHTVRFGSMSMMQSSKRSHPCSDIETHAGGSHSRRIVACQERYAEGRVLHDLDHVSCRAAMSESCK